MGSTASQITSLTQSFIQTQSKKTSKLRVTGLCVGNSPDRWIPRTKGQLRGKCFHLMTSSCATQFGHCSVNWVGWVRKFGCIIQPDVVYIFKYLREVLWTSCQIREIAGAHAPGMPGTFSPSPQVSNPDMHHGTCVTHVPWCMPGSLTSGFIWNRRRGKTFPVFPAHAQPAILRIW